MGESITGQGGVKTPVTKVGISVHINRFPAASSPESGIDFVAEVRQYLRAR